MHGYTTWLGAPTFCLVVSLGIQFNSSQVSLTRAQASKLSTRQLANVRSQPTPLKLCREAGGTKPAAQHFRMPVYPQILRANEL